MIDKTELKRYSRTSLECKEYVRPHAISLVRGCHDLLDNISQNSLDTIELETNLIILRNVFAFDQVLEPFAWEDKGLVAALQRIVDTYFDTGGSVVHSSINLRKNVSQVIANASTSSGEWCRALHQSLFPDRYLSLALTDRSDIGDPLALSLYNMCMSDRGDDGIIDSLVGSNGCLVLSMLLQTEAHYGQNDSLGLLLSYLCFRKNRFKELFLSFAESSVMTNHHPTQWLNSNHAYLVSKLGSDISLLPFEQEDSSNSLVFIHSLVLRMVAKDSEYNDARRKFCGTVYIFGGMPWRNRGNLLPAYRSFSNATWSVITYPC
jgi:hypothetical protein